MPQQVNNKFVLDYNGEINYDNIGVLLTSLKEKMGQHGFKLGMYKKVLAVMVECLENIYKYLDHIHIDQKELKEKQPYFNLQCDDENFYMKAGNPVLKKDSVRLEKKLEETNSLDEVGLKEKYKQIITDGKFTDKGGAGLGFIEMIKTTGNKIGYSFEHLNNELSYFHIALKIPVK